MRALVLSGGGANGAFQIGALKRLYEQGLTFDVVAGVSVGALNGSMIAMDKFEKALEIWENITKDQVTIGSLKLTRIGWRLLRNKKSIMSNAPLEALLTKHLKVSDIKIPFLYGVTDLSTGKYKAIKHPKTDREFVEGVLASTVMPLVWSPVGDLVDGGIRNISPLGDVVKQNPDEVYIINTQTNNLYKESQETMIQIASRTLEILLNEVFQNDLREYFRINKLARDYDIPYKFFKTTLIEPEFPLGDPLDFSNKKANALIEYGYQVASQKE